MIIDIGGGTTDIAVLSLGGKVKATSVRVAGNHYDEEILKFVRNKYSVAIGPVSYTHLPQRGIWFQFSYRKQFSKVGAAGLRGIQKMVFWRYYSANRFSGQRIFKTFERMHKIP